MYATLIKALIALIAVCLLFYWSKKTLSKKKNLSSRLLVIGSAFLIIVPIVHIFEVTRLFAFMGWGNPHSFGHYLDLTSAVLGLTLFPFGLILHWVKK